MSEIMDRLNALDLEAVLRDAVGAAKAAVLAIADADWNLIREFAKEAAKRLRDRGVTIAKALADGALTREDATMLAEEERIVARIQLRSAIGVALATAQKVIDAILGVIRAAFDRVLGFALF